MKAILWTTLAFALLVLVWQSRPMPDFTSSTREFAGPGVPRKNFSEIAKKWLPRGTAEEEALRLFDEKGFSNRVENRKMEIFEAEYVRWKVLCRYSWTVRWIRRDHKVADAKGWAQKTCPNNILDP